MISSVAQNAWKSAVTSKTMHKFFRWFSNFKQNKLNIFNYIDDILYISSNQNNIVGGIFMSQITKKAFAASLKKMLSQKPLDKIKVIDITEDCEVNRQTFYYHFKDIYDLLEWIYTHEASKALDGKKTYDTWQQGFNHIFNYILENKSFALNTFNSVSREYLERYLYNETYTLLMGVIEEKSKDIPIREKDKIFIADFYKYAFVGILLDWIKKGMKENPKDIIDRLNTLIYGNIEEALERYRTDN